MVKKYLTKHIDSAILCMVLCRQMNDAQTKIAQLQEKGWTLAAIADELEHTPNAIQKWKAGHRNPRNYKAIVALLDRLIKRRRIPKKRRYSKNSRGRSENG
jgi:IS30 family transposase